MPCPRCGAEITNGAQTCPKCGEFIPPTPKINVQQKAGQNLGVMNAIHAGTIQGDVIVGDIQQVQIYVLGAEGRVPRSAIARPTAAPYKFLTPYTAFDQELFFGRDNAVNQVLRRIREQPLLVLQGMANVGKTSLLAAGVIPRLVSQDRVLVVSVPDYFRPVKGIREALERNAESLQLTLPPEHNLPALVRAVTNAVNGCLVLVFDHFERLFESSVDDETRAELIQGLVQARDAVEPSNLRIVFSVRQEALPHLWKLLDRLPELAHASYELAPLTPQEARAAILEPLHALDDPITIDDALLNEQLIPDLAELSPDTPGIQPAQLQIVCHYLYQRTRDLRRRHLTRELYDEAKGAAGIMARHVRTTLETELSGEKGLAERILLAMASPGMERWVAPEQLPANKATSKQVYDVLEKLVQTELLTPRSVRGERRYAFACDALKQTVRELASAEDQRRYLAEDELERVWAAWLARDALATLGQLRFLERYAVHVSESEPSRADKTAVLKALLLMRSAVARNSSVERWLAWFCDCGGVALLCQLEQEHAPGDAEAGMTRNAAQPLVWCGQDTMSKAKHMLGLSQEDLPPTPTAGNGYGPVARAAVMHPDAVSRHTAALALTALGNQEALDRLGHALYAEADGWARRMRANELRGLLADADPKIEKVKPPLAGSNALWAWAYRARRRIARDGYRIVTLTVGAAIGAGLGLGLMRAVLALPDPQGFPGIQLGMYFYWGALLGAALAFGMALAAAVCVRQSGNDRACARAAVVLGGVTFGAMHLLIAWLNGLSLVEPFVLPIGFAAGWTLAAALYRQPEAGLHLGVIGWAWRLGIAAVSFVVLQAIPIVAELAGAREKMNGIVIAWDGAHYEPAYYDLNIIGMGMLRDLVPHWFDFCGLADAALLGIVLTVGMTVGLVVANSRLLRWQELRAQAGA